MRIIDDYLAHTGAEERCQNFQETCTILAKVRLDGGKLWEGKGEKKKTMCR